LLALGTGCPALPFRGPSPCPSGDPACKAGSAAVGARDRSAEVAARTAFMAAAPLNQGRFGFAYATVADRVFVFGGGVPGRPDRQPEFLDSIEVYDPLADSWAEVESLPQARYGAAATVVGGKIVVAGGYIPTGKTGAATDSVLVFDPATRELSDGPSLPYAAWGLALATLPTGAVLAAGGMDGPPIFMSELRGTNPIRALDRWTRLSAIDGAWEPGGKLPEPRGMAAVGISFDAVFLVGGRTQPMENQPIGPQDGRIYRFAQKDARWEPVNGSLDPNSGAAAAVVARDSFLIAGGMLDPPFQPGGTSPQFDASFSFGSRRTYLVKLSLAGFQRVEAPEFPSGAMLGGASVIDGRAYVFGGLSGGPETATAHAETYVIRSLPN
jgi:hypothetical protein